MRTTNSEQIKFKAMSIYSYLSDYMTKNTFDRSSIKYLCDLMNYIVCDKLKLTSDVYDIIMEEIIVTSTYHRNDTFSNIIPVFSSIGELL